MSTNLPTSSRFIHTFSSGSNLPTYHRLLVACSTCLMLAGHWSVFGCVTHFHAKLLNLPDVGRSLVTFRLLQIVFIFSASNLPTSSRLLVACSTCLMVAGHWSVFGCVRHFHHNLLMFGRFLVDFFRFINLSDVGRSLDSFQVPGSFSTQPADVQQVTGQ